MKPKKKSGIGWWAAGTLGLISLISIGGSSSAVTTVQQPYISPESGVENAEYQPTEEQLLVLPKKSIPVATTCHPSYEGACLKQNAGDYDCQGGKGDGPNYTGTVRVVGPDVFGLDRDHDGWGCE